MCSGTGCDAKFTSTAQNYSLTPALQPIATSVASTSSNTTAVDTSTATCWGHCGGHVERLLLRQRLRVGHGDCCARQSERVRQQRILGAGGIVAVMLLAAWLAVAAAAAGTVDELDGAGRGPACRRRGERRRTAKATAMPAGADR